MADPAPHTPPHAASGAEGSGDPSMEDILASIRRILNEDDAPPISAGTTSAGTAPAGTAPAGTAPAGTAPAGTAPAGTASPEPPPAVPAPHEAAHSGDPEASPMHVTGASGGDVLMLDASMMVPDQPEPPHMPSAAGPPAPPAVAPPPPTVAPAPEPFAATAPAALIAAETEKATVNSVGSLLRTLTAERTAQVHRGGPTVEDLVREEIRPMLAAWLDAHLPPLVERLVRAEIERVMGRVAP